ncbi:MAG TPA: DUF6636 domain-containing protein [Acidimicrobiales bacterium]|nr:DUF6636 domain-containing protein [Acidimicrobiales bacterium]
MSDLTELEQRLSAELERLTGQVGLGKLSRAEVDRRVAERAHTQRIRRAVVSGTFAVALVALVGVVAFPKAGNDDTRLVTGDRRIAPASVSPDPPAVSASERPTTTPEPTTPSTPPTTMAGPPATGGPKTITFGPITFHAPSNWSILTLQGPAERTAAFIGPLAGGPSNLNLRVMIDYTGTVDALQPTECLEYPIEKPTSVELLESGFAPVGSLTAEYRRWRFTCLIHGVEEHRVWLLPASHIAIVEQRHAPEVADVVATADVETTPPSTRSPVNTSIPPLPPKPTGPSVRFSMPSGNIGCTMQSGGGVVRCDIRQRDWAPPVKPADCEYEFGRILILGRTSGFGCASDTALGAGPVLPYGSTARQGEYECRSDEVGVTCTNLESGHGFLLSAAEYRLF